mmetsp:Transcript_42450/g.88785  ORF Transcript_42450/g.88785 Transcript_42450/m.88785 type:complete len:315 (-) Transcript_42450:249-1193(-)
MTIGISTKDLQKARRNAERKRTSVACARCKVGKTKCSDYRPCKNCKYSKVIGLCVNGDFSSPQLADTWSSSASSDARVHELSMESTPSVTQARFSPSQANTASDFCSLPGPAFGIEFSVSFSAGSTSYPPASGDSCEFSTAWKANLNNVPRNSNESSNSSQEPLRSDRPIHASETAGLLANVMHYPSMYDSPPTSDGPRLIGSHPETSLFLSQMQQYTPDPHHGTAPTFPPAFLPTIPLSLTAPQTLLPPAVAALVLGWSAQAQLLRRLRRGRGRGVGWGGWVGCLLKGRYAFVLRLRPEGLSGNRGPVCPFPK